MGAAIQLLISGLPAHVALLAHGQLSIRVARLGKAVPAATFGCSPRRSFVQWNCETPGGHVGPLRLHRKTSANDIRLCLLCRLLSALDLYSRPPDSHFCRQNSRLGLLFGMLRCRRCFLCRSPGLLQGRVHVFDSAHSSLGFRSLTRIPVWPKGRPQPSLFRPCYLLPFHNLRERELIIHRCEPRVDKLQFTDLLSVRNCLVLQRPCLDC